MPTKTKKRNKPKKFSGTVQSTFSPWLKKRFDNEGTQKGYTDAENMRRMAIKVFSLIDKGVIDDY